MAVRGDGHPVARQDTSETGKHACSEQLQKETHASAEATVELEDHRLSEKLFEAGKITVSATPLTRE